MDNQSDSQKQTGFFRLSAGVAGARWWWFMRKFIILEIVLLFLPFLTRPLLESPESFAGYVETIKSYGLTEYLILLIPFGLLSLGYFLYAFFMEAPKQLWEMEKSRADKLEGILGNIEAEAENEHFDWSGPQTAEYIMEHLQISAFESFNFVKIWAHKGELQIIARVRGNGPHLPIEQDHIQWINIYLLDTHKTIEPPDQLLIWFGDQTHKEGWMLTVKKLQLIYTEPRFMSNEVKRIVNRVEVHDVKG